MLNNYWELSVTNRFVSQATEQLSLSIKPLTNTIFSGNLKNIAHFSGVFLSHTNTFSDFISLFLSRQIS